MTSMSVATRILLVTAGLFLAAPIVSAQDMVKVAPKNCKVLLDNDRVRVIEVRIKPGEKIAMHSHPANVVYSFTAGKAKFTLPDGKAEEREIKAGQAIWSAAVTHASENTGTALSRVLVIELK